MTPDKSLRALFDAALERPDLVERARILDEACGGDVALRERIEKLLTAHDEAGGFLSHPSQKPAGADRAGSILPPLIERPGDWIGRYKLLQRIGEGGCGVVYMAEQEEPVRRRVALKVIKLGMDTKQVVARFEAERQVLALMEHPNIARVLDAGATESGRPFFVMELVRGVKITEFCDRQKLSARARLELFLQVCSAIQHAHQKGIIHRDLKPSNILVTTVDGAPVGKVIDFGIAKATTNQRLTDKTLFTAFEQFIGTPAYMSPEQAEMSGVDIDPRTDIYSLGVVLYELLTGKAPFDAEHLLRAGIDEIRRTIREREPPKPSTRLSALSGDEATTVAQARQTELPSLVNVLRGDLDWIVMKCLEKDRNRRFENVNEFVADLKRHLANEPVVARPASSLYRFQKLIGRHRAVSALSAILLLSLAAGGVILERSHRQLGRFHSQTRAADRARLHDELVAQAHSRIQSRQWGLRVEALDLVRRAAAIHPSLDARNAVAAAFARPDLREVARFPVVLRQNARSPVAFLPDLESFVAPNSDGGFMIQSVSDRTVLAQLRSPLGTAADSFTLSRDGRIVVASTDSQDAELWSWRDQRLLLSLTGTRENPALADVHPDGLSIAGYTPQWGLFLNRLGEPERDVLDASGPGRTFLRFSPDGTRVAAARSDGVLEMWELQGRRSQLAWTQMLDRIVPWLAWSPDGSQLLSAPVNSTSLRVYDAANGVLRKTFNAHTTSPLRQFEFHPDGRTVTSVGRDGVLRLWDARTRQELILAPGWHAVTRFSQDGRRLTAAVSESEVALLELAPVTVFHEFNGSSQVTSQVNLERSPDGSLLATFGREIRLWDTATGRDLGATQVPGLSTGWLVFEPDASAVLISGQGGLVRLPFKVERGVSGRPSIQWGEMSNLAAEPATSIGLTHGGRDLWLFKSNSFELWPNRAPEQARTLSNTATRATVSPDGKWIVFNRVGGPKIHFYDVERAKGTGALTTPGVDGVWFSPDGLWLVVGRRPFGYNVFSVGDWRQGAAWPAKLDVEGRRGDAAFSDDGRLLAVRQNGEAYCLLSFPDCRELVRLPIPEDLLAQGVRFSPDGRRLWIAAANHRMFEWNLTALRKELAALGLDWKD